jgi:hypothetical protein
MAIAPEGATVQLLLGGAWTDVTDDANGDLIDISRGRRNEASRVDPGSCTLTLNNDDGRYSPRNPTSPYYGQLTRNTPLRVSVAGVDDRHVVMSTAPTATITTPDTGSLDITGDIDIRVDLAPDAWTGIGLAQKYQLAGDQRSWFFYMAGLQPRIRWSPDGTVAAVREVNATALAPVVDGQRRAIRVTVDVNNGAGGTTVTFYTAATIAGPWTQLGSPVTSPGTTSFFASSAPVLLADANGLAVVKPAGKLYGFQLRNGINGTLVADLAGDDTEPGPGTTFSDGAGRTWTVTDTWITDPNIRFSGEVSSWPPHSEQTGTVVRVPVEAAGILRRLGRGRAITESVFRQQALQAANLAVTTAYWPGEDGPDATAVASALPGGIQMRARGTTQFAADSTSFPGSAPLLVLSTGSGLNASRIPLVAGTGTLAFRALFAFPPGGLADGTHILDLWQKAGTPRRWRLTYLTGGALGIEAIGDNNTVLQFAAAAFDLNGKAWMLGFTVIQDGANVDWHLFGRHVVDGTVVQGGLDGTFTNLTVDRAAELYIAPNSDFVDTTVGHIMVGTNVSLAANIDEGMTGYAGETAADRIARICDEGGIPCVIVGDPAESEPCGPQRMASRLEVIQDAADADGGILYEPRDFLGLAYRTRTSMYNQRQRAALSITGRELTPPLEPTDDDQLLRNDVTATRLSGSSARVALESGPLSVQEPPDGVGVYPREITVNIASDDRLPDVANWELRLGTWDESRYPTVRVDPMALSHEGKDDLAVDAALLDVGDRFTLTDPPAWLPPGDVDLLAQGFHERFDGYEWQIDATASPGGPWAVGEVADPDAVHGYDQRVAGGDDMVLAAPVDSDDTALLVTSVSGEQRWATPTDDVESAGDFPHAAVVGGERVTVSDVDPGAADSFGRTVASGWGTPTTSGLSATWAVSGGSASDYSVSAGVGRISQGTVGVLRTAMLDIGAANAEITVDTAWPVASATGNTATKWICLRAADLQNYYVAQLILTTAGTVQLTILKRVANSLTSIAAGGSLVTAGANGASHLWRVTFKAAGTSLVATCANLTSGAASARVAGRDTSLTAGTNLILGSRLDAGNTNTTPVVDVWDTLTVATPQILTVTRSANDVVKSHAAGSVIDVTEPAYVAR